MAKVDIDDHTDLAIEYGVRYSLFIIIIVTVCVCINLKNIDKYIKDRLVVASC